MGQTQAERGPSKPAVALVVDDEEHVRKMLAELLEQAGCGCVEAEDGERALELIADVHPDLGVLDINLPGISGAELAWRIRELEPAMALVALSGYLKEWDREDLSDLGFDRVFPKPMDCDAFVSFCKSIADRTYRRPSPPPRG